MLDAVNEVELTSGVPAPVTSPGAGGKVVLVTFATIRGAMSMISLGVTTCARASDPTA